MLTSPVIVWFRQDLRLSDNLALFEAVKAGPIIPIYILDDKNAGLYKMGAASRYWLHHALNALNKSLHEKLNTYVGDPCEILLGLATRYQAVAIYWNRCYELWRIERDKKIKIRCQQENIDVYSFNSSLLWEPWEIKKPDGHAYKVFTAFYRRGCLQAGPPREPIPAPKNVRYYQGDEGSISLDQLQLLPRIRWDRQLEPHWKIGEKGANERLKQFIDEGLSKYKEGRNLPAKPFVSRISPYLHFGEISPNQLWYSVRSIGDNEHIDYFCRELGWREFSYSQLYHNPDLPKKNFQSKFDAFPWIEDKEFLSAWQKGQTGLPMVDAGMRELWQTGYMHGRVRMIVGSFLVKNLCLHWRHGERWFWNTLVDADLANNSASWQWIAGCGADAAPYFRIFNPVTQAEKFDPEGDYVRRFIPEIALLPNKYLFSPWEAPDYMLRQAGIKLGGTYPHPIVDLKQSRAAALMAFQSLKQAGQRYKFNS